MKYLILVPDGMADYPLRQLSWRTPLMAAEAPTMKSLGRKGRMGLFQSIPRAAQAGSDVANMSIMGYDPVKELTGRGALESAALGIDLEDDEIAFRCNLVSAEGGRIKDYSAGYISTEEGHELVDALRAELDTDRVRFYGGRSFRNILVIKDRGPAGSLLTTPPHDIVGQPFSPYLPKALTLEAKRLEERVRALISRSREILKDHPINARRRKNRRNPGDMIWPWSPGRKLRIRPFAEIWGISGLAVSAVDTVRGLAKSAGMEAPEIPGATGFVDTDYEAKASRALEALRNHDLIYVHVEGIDEMGHSGDILGKRRAIDDTDARLLGPLVEGLESHGWDYRVAVIPDHYTPSTVRTHVRDPTPFVIACPGEEDTGRPEYNEENAKRGTLGLLRGDEFIKTLLSD